MELLFVLAMSAFGVLWWQSKGVKQAAFEQSRRYLHERGLEILDGGVVLKALWFRRDPRGGLRLWRRYRFEFISNGAQRYQGDIVLLGRHVESIRLEPYQVPDQYILH